jgi:hypothetical protein
MDPRDLLQSIGADTNAADMVTLLEHPGSEEAHILAALRKRNLPSAAIEAVARHERWNGRYRVKAAIVNHPKTPKTLALRLMSLLFWKELLRTSANFRLSMPIRIAAENHLVAKLSKMEMGEKISLARSAPARVISQLLEESQPRVIDALLMNPRIREAEVVRLAEDTNVASESLRVLARSERWSSRYTVKMALVKNRRTPVHAALTLLGSLPRREIEKLVSSAALPRVVLVRAHQLLERNHFRFIDRGNRV